MLTKARSILTSEISLSEHLDEAEAQRLLDVNLGYEPAQPGDEEHHTEAPEEAAMDTLAEEMDQVMARLQRAGMAQCAPKLNPKGDPAKWLSDQHAPWKKLANEKPKGETIAYDSLLNAWKNGKVR